VCHPQDQHLESMRTRTRGRSTKNPAAVPQSPVKRREVTTQQGSHGRSPDPSATLTTCVHSKTACTGRGENSERCSRGFFSPLPGPSPFSAVISGGGGACVFYAASRLLRSSPPPEQMARRPASPVLLELPISNDSDMYWPVNMRQHRLAVLADQVSMHDRGPRSPRAKRWG
jgi:hypothetical protein